MELVVVTASVLFIETKPLQKGYTEGQRYFEDMSHDSRTEISHRHSSLSSRSMKYLLMGPSSMTYF